MITAVFLYDLFCHYLYDDFGGDARATLHTFNIGWPLQNLSHRLLYTWIGHEIFGTDIRVVMGSNGSKISEV